MQSTNSLDKQGVIGITDYVTPPADIEQKAFPEAEFIFLKDWKASPKSADQWRKVHAILVWHWHVEPETIKLLENCKIVVRYGVGYDAIDVAALAKKGIPFCNTPDYGTAEVADTACAMILAIQRKILAYHQACKRYTDSWQENLLKPHYRTSNQTLGVIGVGRIGTAVINRLKAFGYTILGYDPYLPEGHEKTVGYERAGSLKELLNRSDIVSINCDLNSETLGMVNQDFIDQMKPGSSLVNTARGKIIENLDCLEAALRTGYLNYIALDVLPDEPPVDHPLIMAWRDNNSWLEGRLLINPHSAYYSEAGWYDMRYKAAETARLYLLKNELRNKIDE